MQIPGAVINPPAPPPAANIANAGQFHMMSPQEQLQRETEAQLARAHQISQETGVPVERVLGMQPKYSIAPWGAGTFNTQTGEIETASTPKPLGAPVQMIDETGQRRLVQRYQDGTMKPLDNPAGLSVAAPPSTLDTIKSSEFHYVDADGNVHAVPTTSTSHKVQPGTGKSVAGPTPPPGVTASSPKPTSASASASASAPAASTGTGGGKIISGNAPKATALDTAIQKDALKASQTSRVQINLLDSAEDYIKKGKFDSAGDLSLLVQAVRAMNPGTVRLPVQEITMEAKRGTYGDNFRRWFETKVVSGTLPSDQREQLINVMRRETEKVGADAAANWEQNMKGKPLPPHLKRFASTQTNGGGAGPAIGTVEDGHRFKGGDPADPANWEKVQ